MLGLGSLPAQGAAKRPIAPLRPVAKHLQNGCAGEKQACCDGLGLLPAEGAAKRPIAPLRPVAKHLQNGCAGQK